MKFQKIIFTPWLWLILAIGFVLIVQIPIFLKDTNHLAYNPEPTPDALFYMIGADNIARGEGYGLFYHGSKMGIFTPPLYIFYLTIWRLIIPNSQIFFVAGNIFLQMAVVFLLYKIGRKISLHTHQMWVVPALLGLYLSFAAISWYVSVAMIENLGLLIMAAILAVLVLMENNWKQWLCLVVLAGACIAAKFTFLPLAAVIFLIIFIKLIQQKQYNLIICLVIIGVIMLATAWFAMPVIGDVLFRQSVFTLDNLPPNLEKLWLVLSGQSEWILWRYIPFGTGLIWPIVIGLTIVNWKNKQLRLMNIFCWILLVSLLPIQLVFGVFDVRYLLQFVPIVVVMIISNAAVVMENAKNIKKQLGWMILIGILFVAQFCNQVILWRDLYRSNILHSEVPWHFVAIRSFDDYFSSRSEQNNYLAYFIFPHSGRYMSSLKTYRFLPITNDLIYFGGAPSMYGTDLDHERLLNDRFNYYDELISGGAQLYVSNYGTDKIETNATALEELKQYFHAELVQEGCLGGCNLYKLHAH